MKAVTQTIENESEEQRGVFLGVLSGALGASLSGNMLAAKRATTASQKGLGVNRRWRWRSNSNELKTSFLIAPYPLTSFKVEKYQNEPRFNGVYSRNHLHNSKLKDGTHTCNKSWWVQIRRTSLNSFVFKIVITCIIASLI